MKYSVNGVRVVATKNETLVQGSLGVHLVEFVFDDTWNEFTTRKAVFKRGDTVIEALIIDGKCEIPWEMLTECGMLQIGVYGESADKRRPTLWASPKTVNPGAEVGEASREPTPDMWQQLLADLSRVAPHIGESGNWYVGEVDTGVPARGDKGDSYILTAADKDEIAKKAAIEKLMVGKQLTLNAAEWVDDSDIVMTKRGLPHKYMRIGYTTTADKKGGAMLTEGTGVLLRNEWQTVSIEFSLADDAEAFGLYFLGGQNSKFIQPYDIMDVKVYAAGDSKKRNRFIKDIEEQKWVTNNADTQRAIAMSDGVKFMHVFRQSSNITRLYSSAKVPLKAGEYVFECRIRLSPWLYHYVAPFYDAHSEYSLSVSPARDSVAAYNGYGVHCAAFGNFSVIFGCDTIPEEDISVNAMIYKASGDPGMIFQPTHESANADAVMTLEEPIEIADVEEVVEPEEISE